MSVIFRTLKKLKAQQGQEDELRVRFEREHRVYSLRRVLFSPAVMILLFIVIIVAGFLAVEGTRYLGAYLERKSQTAARNATVETRPIPRPEAEPPAPTPQPATETATPETVPDLPQAPDSIPVEPKIEVPGTQETKPPAKARPSDAEMVQFSPPRPETGGPQKNAGDPRPQPGTSKPEAPSPSPNRTMEPDGQPATTSNAPSGRTMASAPAADIEPPGPESGEAASMEFQPAMAPSPRSLHPVKGPEATVSGRSLAETAPKATPQEGTNLDHPKDSSVGLSPEGGIPEPAIIEPESPTTSPGDAMAGAEITPEAESFSPLPEDTTAPGEMPAGPDPVQTDSGKTPKLIVVSKDNTAKIKKVMAVSTQIQDALERNDLAKAEELLDAVRELKTRDDPYVVKMTAYLAILQNDFNTARPLLEGFLAKHEDDLEAQVNLAVIDIRTRRFPEARQRLLSLKTMYPENTMILDLLQTLP